MLIRRRLTIAHLDYVNQRFAAALQQMPRLDEINEQLNQMHVPQLCFPLVRDFKPRVSQTPFAIVIAPVYERLDSS